MLCPCRPVLNICDVVLAMLRFRTNGSDWGDALDAAVPRRKRSPAAAPEGREMAFVPTACKKLPHLRPSSASRPMLQAAAEAKPGLELDERVVAAAAAGQSVPLLSTAGDVATAISGGEASGLQM